MQVLLAPPKITCDYGRAPGGPIAPVRSPAAALAGFQRDCERQARQALGEAAFQAAYHRGLQLPAGDAVAYALRQPPPAPAVPAEAPLTPLEVARLIAGGRSNKEIPPSW
jgi:DNA-binding NarL/FixJ family response regulator